MNTENDTPAQPAEAQPATTNNSVADALDTMRNHLHDYEHDSSDRWEKYKKFKETRKQISQRAKQVK